MDNLERCEKRLTELDQITNNEIQRTNSLNRIDLIDTLEKATGAFSTSWECIDTDAIRSIVRNSKVRSFDNQRALALCKCASENKIEIPDNIDSLSQLNIFMRKKTGISKILRV